MSQPAARIGDMHVCPLVTPAPAPVPHVGGPVLPPGNPTVLIGGAPAAAMGDMCTCVGPPDVIAMGAATVLIGGRPAARMGDTTMHGGTVAMGLPTVLIGGAGTASVTPPGPTTILGALWQYIKNIFDPPTDDPRSPDNIVAQVNPLNGGVNCGHIIDAVIARLDGSSPYAITATTDRDGSWAEIEARHGTKFTWGKDFKQVYDEVKAGGPGTTHIVGMGGKKEAHVVVITNHNGTPMILEGQGGGATIGSADDATARYDPAFYGDGFQVGSAPL